MILNHKKKILVFTDWFLPGYRAGGPIRSLANLVEHIDEHFYIVTRNTDHHDSTPYENIIPNKWIGYNNHVEVFYASEDQISNKLFKHLIAELKPDLFYFNSLFSPKFTIKPLRLLQRMGYGNRCIVAPRGMLKSGALSIKSKKKIIFLRIAKLIGLYHNVRWHATNSDEINEIKKWFPSAKSIQLAPNLPSAAGDKPTKIGKKTGELRLTSIARISKEKGTQQVIEFLKAANLNGQVICEFYGTEQDRQYLDECKTLAESIPQMDIRFCGEIRPEDIGKALQSAHFFILATWGENFGHAIAEALNHATPVIISNRTPWRDLERVKAGWDIPLESHSFINVLHHCLQMDEETYQLWSEGAYQLGKKVSFDASAVEASRQLFQ